MRGEGSRPAEGKYICMWDLPAAGGFTVGGRFYFWASRDTKQTVARWSRTSMDLDCFGSKTCDLENDRGSRVANGEVRAGNEM